MEAFDFYNFLTKAQNSNYYHQSLFEDLIIKIELTVMPCNRNFLTLFYDKTHQFTSP